MKQNSKADRLEETPLLPEEFRVLLSKKLRTPLNDIMGFAELLATEGEATNQNDSAQQILSAAKELLEIIDTELGDPPGHAAKTELRSSSAPSCDVLYVEDEPRNVVLVQRILAQRAHLRLMHAGTGEAGVDLARTHLPRLILLDLNLPGIGGGEVLRRLQQDASTADIPVVVISADATPSQIERLLTAGARDYLTKPFSIQNFLAVIDQILEEKSL
jgi:CheY-like chemotaxis protein